MTRILFYKNSRGIDSWTDDPPARTTAYKITVRWFGKHVHKNFLQQIFYE